MREPVTKVFRRAGCGKSARPVRRGDGEPRDSSVALRPTLPALIAEANPAYSQTHPKNQGKQTGPGRTTTTCCCGACPPPRSASLAGTVLIAFPQAA